LAEPSDAEPTLAATTPRRPWRLTRTSQRTPGKPAAGPAAAKKKKTTRIAVIAGTAALTTAVSGVVGGVVSPDRVQSVLGLSDEATESAAADATTTDPTETASEPALEFKQVIDRTGAIVFDVPSTWGRVDDGFVGIAGISSPGRALRAGPDPNGSRIQSDETAYVGASTQALDDLGLVGLDDRAVVATLERRREGATHLAEAGCVPTSDHTPQLGDDWLGAVQVWRDCFAIDGWRAIEIEMVSADRDTYVFIQIGLPAATPDEVAQRLLDSLDVLTARLPAQEAQGS